MNKISVDAASVMHMNEDNCATLPSHLKLWNGTLSQSVQSPPAIQSVGKFQLKNNSIKKNLNEQIFNLKRL
ncbi:hypothetical protein BpHYR1_054099 [Brachionus plicatilis]|uniref:Uncharacterized protein n=1 Tax=Brachionus plicatilis TaxID=10195 RepID=A0A3M7QFB9_BRAPC|nr:hypothetical protein BpHYR1_054099 [Brachionus plicatilis]